MGIKSSFVIFLCSIFLISCAQVPKVNFRNKEAPRDIPAAEDSGEPGEEVIEEDESVNFETKKSEKPFRPKVALVLGPGASRSFAHIGLLKEIKSANIPIHSIIGMGWSAIVAAEYVDQKSVHGLEWKVSRSESLKKLSETSFWSSTIKEKTTRDAELIIQSLLTSSKGSRGKKGEFTCPLLSKRKSDMVFADKRGLKNCIAIPPLFNPGKAYAPYLFDTAGLKKGALQMGAEKVIFVDVLNRNRSLFGAKESSVTGAAYWYWGFVAQMTEAGHDAFDKVIEINVDSEILNFETSLKSVRQGQAAGGELVEFLQREYQY